MEKAGRSIKWFLMFGNDKESEAQSLTRKSFLRDIKLIVNSEKLLIIILLVYYFFNIFVWSQLQEVELSRFVYDDAFYYLVLAQNRAYLGFWTFDGETTTTGFHLLHAFVLVGLFQINPSFALMEVFLIVSTITALSLVLLFYFVIRLSKILGIRSSLRTALLIPFILPSTLKLVPGMMESWAVLLFAGCILCLVFLKPLFRLSGPLSGLLGILGVFGRSDFILFGFILVCSCFITLYFFQDGYLRRNISMFASGLILGQILLTIYVYSQSGSFVQQSVSIKRYWSDLINNPIELATAHYLNSFFLFDFTASNLNTLKIGTGLLTLAFLYICFSLRKKMIAFSEEQVKIFLIATLFIGAFSIAVIAFYRLGSWSLQPWYVASYFPGVIMSWVLAIAWISRIKVRFAKVLPSVFFIVLLASAFKSQAFASSSVQSPTAYYATQLKQEDSDVRIGSWNAGTLSYYSERRIINLDGLMNNEVHSYTIRRQLLDYLAQNEINRIMDFEGVFRDKKSRERNGFLLLPFLNCIKSLKYIPTPEPFRSSVGRFVDISLKPSCLKNDSNN